MELQSPPVIRRMSDKMPLNPESDAAKLVEQRVLAAWNDQMDALIADGWHIERENKMMHPPTGTYRLYNELRRSDG